jgi:hypothetical protein
MVYAAGLQRMMAGIEAGAFAQTIAIDYGFTGICDDITCKSGHFVANLLFLGFKS